MALNQFMHPRNRYRDIRPDFKMLAEKYAEFREHTTTDLKGKVHVEFRDPASLRALTWALLKDDFDIDISVPLDRLIPTVPLRLNYILWLEDIFTSAAESPLHGIDIGTGASCVYPLLGAKLNGWQFIATDADATNIDYAMANVSRNNLADKIKVVHVAEDTTLLDVLRDSNDNYDFCMCNPPFYGSNLEAWGWLTTRKDSEKPRAEPTSVSTASPIEGIAPGGEVQFVRERIIESSLELKTRVRVYTTMLGKKSSMATLKEALRMKGITNIGTTEFCQGKTMRWGLAWTFDSTITFPKPISKVLKAQKSKPPLCHTLPDKYTSVSDVAAMMECIFDELQISHSRITWSDSESGDRGWRIKCQSNTWTHQRRRRRQMMRAGQLAQNSTSTSHAVLDKSSASDPDVSVPALHDTADAGATAPKETGPSFPVSVEVSGDRSSAAVETVIPVHDSADDSAVTPEGTALNPVSFSSEDLAVKKSDLDMSSEDDQFSTDYSVPPAKRARFDLTSPETEVEERSVQNQDKTSNSAANNTSSDSGDTVLMVCSVTVRKADFVKLEMSWVDGQNRELMHQLLQFFKNRFV